jgi:outer membrane protein assembly factor BamB
MTTRREPTRARTARATLLLLAVACSGLGCENLSSIANPEVPLWANHPGAFISVFARRELTAVARKVGEPYEHAKPTIDAAHQRVFVGSADHGLYALDAIDLDTLWRFETAGAVQSEPLYDPRQDAVYFGSNDGALYKLRAADGKLLWRFASNAEITRPPVLHDGKLFVVNANDTLIAIDPDSGKLVWYRNRQPAAGMEIAGYAGCSVSDDRIYTAFSDGVVMAYRTGDGAEAWGGFVDLAADAQQNRGGEELRYFDVDTTPVVAETAEGESVFVASYEGGVYSLDALGGAQQWVNDGVTGVTELILWEGPVKARKGRVAVAPRSAHRWRHRRRAVVRRAVGRHHALRPVLVSSARRRRDGRLPLRRRLRRCSRSLRSPRVHHHQRRHAVRPAHCSAQRLMGHPGSRHAAHGHGASGARPMARRSQS